MPTLQRQLSFYNTSRCPKIILCLITLSLAICYTVLSIFLSLKRHEFVKTTAVFIVSIVNDDDDDDDDDVTKRHYRFCMTCMDGNFSPVCEIWMAQRFTVLYEVTSYLMIKLTDIYRSEKSALHRKVLLQTSLHCHCHFD